MQEATLEPKDHAEPKRPAEVSQEVRPGQAPTLRLQRALGNRAMTRVLQAKLTVSEWGDIYEQEADRVADQVMRSTTTADHIIGTPPQVQLKCAPCEATGTACPKCEEEENTEQVLHRSASGDRASPEVPPVVYEVLRSPGDPLDANARAFFEPRFGYDFSKVRVHTDEQAAGSAKAVNARAYTVENNIFFGEGEYTHGTRAGRWLLAHELTHTIQQAGISDSRRLAGQNASRGAGASVIHKNEGDRRLARAPEPADQPGTSPSSPVVLIRIEKTSGKIEFVTISGQIYSGTVETDLEPGNYQLAPDLPHQKWLIQGSKPGLRFSVKLDNGDPWKLAYTTPLSLAVAAGPVTTAQAFTELSKGLAQEISSIEGSISEIKIFKGDADVLRRTAEWMRTTLAEADKLASDNKTDEAGTRYQGVLLAAQVARLYENYLLVAEYANTLGEPSVQIQNILVQALRSMTPLATAALSLDRNAMTKAVNDHGAEFRQTASFLAAWVTAIDKGARFSRRVIQVLNILMLAINFYSILKTPTLPEGPAEPPVAVPLPGGVAAASAINFAAVAEALEAIKKLIAIGALDPAVVSVGTTVVGGGKAAAPPGLQGPTTMQMSGPTGKGVEIVDSKGKSLGEFDEVKPDRLVEDKSAKGLQTPHPKTGKPVQTADEWAETQIFDKTVTRIENFTNEATATRPTPSGSPTVPTLAEIKAIRHIEFRVESVAPDVQAAVTKQIAALTAKYPGWTFTATFGP